MSSQQIEAAWVVLSTEYRDAGWQCILARHAVEKSPMTQDAIVAYAKASEHWVDLVLKTSDFVRDCRTI